MAVGRSGADDAIRRYDRGTPLAKADRSLEKVEKLIELFEPFILLNEHDFVAENVEKLSYALVAEEKQLFDYDTDPGELTNLAGVSKHAMVLAQMKALLKH